MQCYVTQLQKSTTQSGKKRSNTWVLTINNPYGYFRDSCYGWQGCSGSLQQLRLTFPDYEAAQLYAQQHNLVVNKIATPSVAPRRRSYAANFTRYSL